MRLDSNTKLDNYNYEIDINKISNKKIIIGCLQSHYKINIEFELVLKEILDNLILL